MYNLTDDQVATIEKALYYARSNADDYWHNWSGDKSESDTLDKIDAALDALSSPVAGWLPMPNLDGVDLFEQYLIAGEIDENNP